MSVTRLRLGWVSTSLVQVYSRSVKISASKADSFVKAPPAELRVALIYGPDEGLVRERAAALGATVVADLMDPFLVCEMTGGDICSDPARLADEVAAIALTGGRRLVRVRDAVEGISKAVQTVLDGAPGDAFTILQAGQLARDQRFGSLRSPRMLQLPSHVMRTMPGT